MNPKIDILLEHIRLGKKPITLCKQLNISKQLLTYYLKVLKDKGIIRKLGFGLWEIVKDMPNHDGKKEVRAHAFIWKIKLNNIKNWDKREELLKKAQITVTRAGKTLRIEIKGKKVWLNNKSIIIYENKSFYDFNPVETRKLAIYELISTLKELENKIGINLGNYKFTTKREHFALIKNDLAHQCNLEGDKIRVRDNGELWFEIDNSFNLDEAEFYKTKSYSGLTNSSGAQGYFNSHKNTNWKVTPEFTLEALNKLSSIQAENQKQVMQFTEQIKSHLALIQEYRKENIKYRESWEVKKKAYLKESQTTLGDY